MMKDQRGPPDGFILRGNDAPRQTFSARSFLASEVELTPLPKRDRRLRHYRETINQTVSGISGVEAGDTCEGVVVGLSPIFDESPVNAAFLFDHFARQIVVIDGSSTLRFIFEDRFPEAGSFRQFDVPANAAVKDFRIGPRRYRIAVRQKIKQVVCDVLCETCSRLIKTQHHTRHRTIFDSNAVSLMPSFQTTSTIPANARKMWL